MRGGQSKIGHSMLAVGYLCMERTVWLFTDLVSESPLIRASSVFSAQLVGRWSGFASRIRRRTEHPSGSVGCDESS
jgi:hypothetical protein